RWHHAADRSRATLLQLSAILLRHVMTLPLTLTAIVLALSPADSYASTGTARPINRFNLQCRPFLPRRLTHLRRIDLDHRSRAQTSRPPLERPTKTQRQAPTSLRHYPHSIPPTAASFNPASISGSYEVALTHVFPARSCHATSQNPQERFTPPCRP